MKETSPLAQDDLHQMLHAGTDLDDYKQLGCLAVRTHQKESLHLG